MNTFSLTVSSPNGNIFKGEAVKLSLRGSEGELAILAGHIPLITAVKPCEYRILLPGGAEESFTTGGGLLVVSESEVTLLSGKNGSDQ